MSVQGWFRCPEVRMIVGEESKARCVMRGINGAIDTDREQKHTHKKNVFEVHKNRQGRGDLVVFGHM